MNVFNQFAGTFWSLFKVIIYFIGIPGAAYATWVFFNPDNPKFTYYELDGRSVLAESKDNTSIEVFYKGQKVNSPVVVAQVAVWNDGKKTIKETLKPTVLTVGFGEDLHPPVAPEEGPSGLGMFSARIFEASIISFSRKEIGFELSKISPDSIELSWKLLEENDGGLIQIVYEGSRDVPISLAFAAEGQKSASVPEAHFLAKIPKVVLAGGALLFGLAGLLVGDFETFPGKSVAMRRLVSLAMYFTAIASTFLFVATPTGIKKLLDPNELPGFVTRQK